MRRSVPLAVLLLLVLAVVPATPLAPTAEAAHAATHPRVYDARCYQTTAFGAEYADLVSCTFRGDAGARWMSQVDFGNGYVSHSLPREELDGVTRGGAEDFETGGQKTIRMRLYDPDVSSAGSDWLTVTFTPSTDPEPAVSLRCDPDVIDLGAGQEIKCRGYIENAPAGEIVVDWGDGSGVQRYGEGELRHTYAAARRGLTVIRAHGEVPTATTPYTTLPQTVTYNLVANRAPLAHHSTCFGDDEGKINKGGTLRCRFFAWDDSPTFDGVYGGGGRIRISWGDGAVTSADWENVGTGYGVPRTGSHVYSQEGSYTIKALLTDTGSPAATGETVIGTVTVVSDAAPTGTASPCTPSVARANTEVQCVITGHSGFSTLNAVVTWGDGRQTTQEVSAGVATTFRHTYTGEGAFPVTATFRDTNGKTGTVSTMAYVGTHAQPVLTQVSCASNGAAQDGGREARCTFRATDDSSGLHYLIEWGDGSSPQRVPATGTMAAGTQGEATHSYAALGSYAVNVTAVDAGTPSFSSVERSETVHIEDRTPTIQQFSCTPTVVYSGDRTTCRFYAEDDDKVAYVLTHLRPKTGSSSAIQVAGPDGRPKATTEFVPGERFPTRGFTAAGSRSAVETLVTMSGVGNHTLSLTATDNDGPARTSPVAKVGIVVKERPNDAPRIDSIACSPGKAKSSVTCKVRVVDDSAAPKLRVSWGDLSSSTESGTASTKVTPVTPWVKEWTFQTSHTYSKTGNFKVTFKVEDQDGRGALTSKTESRNLPVPYPAESPTGKPGVSKPTRGGLPGANATEDDGGFDPAELGIADALVRDENATAEGNATEIAGGKEAPGPAALAVFGALVVLAALHRRRRM